MTEFPPATLGQFGCDEDPTDDEQNYDHRSMGRFTRIGRWLRDAGSSANPGVDDGDPDEFVELVTVPLHEGPMLVATFQRLGIEAIGAEAFNRRGQSFHPYQVAVKRRDRAKAMEIFNDPERDLRPPRKRLGF